MDIADMTIAPGVGRVNLPSCPLAILEWPADDIDRTDFRECSLNDRPLVRFDPPNLRHPRPIPVRLRTAALPAAVILRDVPLLV